MKIRLAATMISAATILFSSFAVAGALREDKGETDWEILLAPYLWAVSLEGSAGVGDLPPMDVDASFGDILDNLNMAMSLHTEFHRGRFAFVIDPTYISLEIEVDTPGSVASPKADVDIWLVEAWGSYKVTDSFELLGGARWQEQEIKVNLGLPSPPFSDSDFGLKDDWLDWFIGGRLTVPMGEKWRFMARADAVIAGDSDSSYNIEAFLDRRIRKTMALKIGYRYFEDDYENESTYLWDVKEQGPMIGYIWSF